MDGAKRRNNSLHVLSPYISNKKEEVLPNKRNHTIAYALSVLDIAGEAFAQYLLLILDARG